MIPLNIFYQEPDPDRWVRYDHYPRKIIRRVIRGRQRPGGVTMVAINLLKGLDELGVPYRYNNFKYARDHPEELVCIIGKPHLLFEREWENPILFGAGIFSHPSDFPGIFNRYPNLKQILVPGEWMRLMFEPYYGNKVTAWPVGIDTDAWKPGKTSPRHKVLIYDKMHDKYDHELLHPIIKFLADNHISYDYIKYGNYEPHELLQKVNNAETAIFLCEHETQGLAYQQILATGTPILAWDRGGYWLDPAYYPDKVKFNGVSSVPYWDEGCGMTFKDITEFHTKFNLFIDKYNKHGFNPREYILENLTLKKCASEYLKIVNRIRSQNEHTS